MKKINFLNILIILALCACGYTPIYKGMKNVNYEIEITKLNGDNLINLSLIHISEPTRRTPISYAVFCLKKNLWLWEATWFVFCVL